MNTQENRPRRAGLAAYQSLLHAALDYVARGWNVFPCHEHTTSTHRAKSPRIRGGFKAATTNPELVAAWWFEYPDALIGLAIPPGTVVLDIDDMTALADLEEIAGDVLPATLTARTGRGMHLYYRHPSPFLTQGGIRGPSGLLQGVDVRIGGKGYLIGPPSPHPDTGKPYAWIDRTPAASLPPALAAAMVPPPPRDRTVVPGDHRAGHAGLLRALAAAPVGQRNNTLYWCASRMAERELAGQTTVWDALELIAHSIGLSSFETRTTVDSARGRVMGRA